MELIDSFVSKINKIKNKFLVVVIDDESDDDSDVTRLQEDIMTRIDYRMPEFHEFDSTDLIFLGNIMLISTLFLRNMMFILKLSYFSFLIVNGFGFSFAIVSYSYNFIKHLEKSKLEEYELEDKEYNQSLEYQYNEFLNVYYDEFKQLYQEDSKEYESMCLNDETKLKALKDKEHHFELSLPIEKNNKIILFYDHENKVFNYYTKTSDVVYKVLNACCRNYVYEKKCINLFQDEEEINYIKSLSHDNTETEIQTETKTDSNSQNEPYEELHDISGNDTKPDDEQEKKGGIFSMFHNKAESKEKMKKNEMSVNKFIRLGNIEDYNKKYKPKQDAKKIDYNDFKKLFDKNQS